ncbi:TonB-dependent receptor [hydrothermal vent metagenome]|uniref:TonB-dependent receptor n=1 Tax=hydrothermal vent metagenome TaxID=652676 RepID=A0A3B0X6Y0_9ZZZZ
MINNKQHKSLIALSGLLLGLTQSTYSIADHPDDTLEHFISLSLEDLISLETTIATASKQTATKAPAVVTLITAEDIKATGATNLVDVLSGVPGLHIRASQFGNRPLIQFRGAKGTQTLLMIDGNSMVDLVWNFGIFWKGLPASVIERVEIIRGPGSARFGADASAGVINVITKVAGKIDYSEVGVSAGSFNTKSAWMQHGDNWGGFQVGMTANISDTEGHNPLIEIDGQTARDQLFNTTVSQAPGNAQYGYRNSDVRFSIAKENWRLNAGYMGNRKVEIGLTGFGVLDAVTEGNDSRYNIDTFYNNADISENWELDIELRYQDLSYSSGAGFQERPPGFTDDTGTYPNGQINQQRSSERRVVFDASTLYNGFKNHSIRVGAGYTWQDLYSVEQLVNFGTGPDGNDLPAGGPLVDLSGSPFAFAPENTRQISHLYIQDIWTISNAWELTAGARYDDYSDFGSTVNPRLALVWQSTEKLTTKLLYGKAFRPPSYLELFDETSFTKPNPNLEPERSQTWDLSFNYAARKNLQLTLNLFSFEHTDIITNSNISGQFQNNGDHHIKGIELEARWQASKDVNFYANYTYRNQDESRFRAIQEADEEAYFRSDWGLLPKWNWNLQANYIGERPRNTSGANPDTRAPVKAYVVTDTTLRYAATNSWEFAASIRNLFDTDAREFTGRGIPNDLPLPERSAYAEIRYKF